ncbi:MipA/OmpV family protein [Pseudoalteromonas sp. SSDWG2]|uniref:MipA/OmpV family protein n=1 Tax=Pseudoalteromonas sp. SSDWG2 TaxID=3139391 RepID=UPI003BAA3A36
MSRVVVFFLLICSAGSTGKELELGAGVFSASIPHYLGSSQHSNYTLPLPYVVYRSDNLSVDRNSAVGYLWQYGPWHLDISATAAFAVDSQDNTARKGMDDLDWVFELGPALDYYIEGKPQADDFFKLGVFTRKALATDFSDINDLGFRFGPYLHWKKEVWQQDDSSVTLTSRAAVNFATSQYVNYFYGVVQSDVTATRSYYKGRSGYSGSELSIGVSYDSNRWWLGGFVKYYRLKDSTWQDSPLVERHHNIAIGAGVAWKFYRLAD